MTKYNFNGFFFNVNENDLRISDRVCNLFWHIADVHPLLPFQNYEKFNKTFLHQSNNISWLEISDSWNQESMAVISWCVGWIFERKKMKFNAMLLSLSWTNQEKSRLLRFRVHIACLSKTKEEQVIWLSCIISLLIHAINDEKAVPEGNPEGVHRAFRYVCHQDSMFQNWGKW